jgi:hypothetical protein
MSSGKIYIHWEAIDMFTIIGVLAVIMIIGFLIMLVGVSLFEGALKLIVSIVALFILLFAFKGCMMG